jgi:hypothetical protein
MRVWVYSRSPIPHSPRFGICATGPRPDRRRALELLASCLDGCTEGILCAAGLAFADMIEWQPARRFEIASGRSLAQARRALEQAL